MVEISLSWKRKSNNSYPTKIYIDRKDSVSNTRNLRSILNEDQIIEFLKNKFEILTLSNYSFKEQVRVINNAKVIVGLHGAGFANFVFVSQILKW